MQRFSHLKMYVNASPILVLSLIPFDMPTCLLWLIGFYYFIKGLFGVCRFLFTKKTNLPIPHTAIAQTIFFPVVVVMVYVSLKVAENYAFQMSNKINELCNKEQKCPAEIDGWSKNQYGRISTESGFSAKYKVVYWHSEDLQSFELKVVKNIDLALFFYGGVNQSVRNHR